jgi:hypothetical protein
MPTSHVLWTGQPLAYSAVQKSGAAADPETASAPIVIAVDEKTVTFTTNVKALIAFEANFGSERISVEDEIEFQLVITVFRDIDPEPRVVDVQVAKEHLAVDFGEIFCNEDPTHEKY